MFGEKNYPEFINDPSPNKPILSFIGDAKAFI